MIKKPGQPRDRAILAEVVDIANSEPLDKVSNKALDYLQKSVEAKDAPKGIAEMVLQAAQLASALAAQEHADRTLDGAVMVERTVQEYLDLMQKLSTPQGLQEAFGSNVVVLNHGGL
jgi:hypothetical protein